MLFFFRGFTAYFLLDLTPLHLLRLLPVALLTASIVVIVIDTYFHFNDTRKNLIYSFIPSGMIIAGIGSAVARYPLSLSNLPHYLLLALMIIVVLMDHDRVLRMIPAKALAPRKEIEHALYQRSMMLTKMALENLDKLEARNPEYEGLFPAKALAFALLGDTEQAMRYWEEAQKREKKEK
ncbi:MAG: hypothetical protein AB1485_04915 [Candidatus Thermoplasmatota archaeon]